MNRRLPFLLLLLGVVFACVTTLASPSKDSRIFRVENFNWSAATVIFECSGSILHRERQIETGREVTARVDLRGCTSPRFAVRLLADRDTYISPYLIWNRGDVLEIKIENAIHQTSFMMIARDQ